MSKQRINELHEALHTYTTKDDLMPPSLQTPEHRRARIRELAVRHLASMPPEEFAGILADVKAEHDRDAAASKGTAEAKAEGARHGAEERAAEKAGQDAPSEESPAVTIY